MECWVFSAMLPAPLVPPPKCSGHTSSDWQGGRTFAYGDTVRGATGGIVEVGGECYGDAVNVAARLCERFGPAENGLHNFLSCWPAVSRNAPASWGTMEIRAKGEVVVFYQVEWRQDQEPDSLTVQSRG